MRQGDRWVVEADTLDDLLALMRREGFAVLLSGWAIGLPKITIVDGRLE